MRNKAPVLLLLAAVVLAAVAAWGSHYWLEKRAREVAAQKAALSPVVVAALDLPAGHKLEAGQLKVQQWPSPNVPAGAFSNPAQLKDRALRAPLVAGEVLTETKVAPKGVSGGLSAVVPPGFRAMTVRVDEVVGVGGFVQPGDRVDVLVTLATGEFRENPASRVVLQDILVLTSGEVYEKEANAAKPSRRKVQVVTLQLDPEQGEVLALSAQEGKVVLALRSQTDRENKDTSGIRLASLIPGAEPAPSEAAVLPSPPAQEKPEGPAVEIIKGVERSVQSF